LSVAGIGQALKAYGAAMRHAEAKPAAAADPASGGFAGLVRSGLEAARADLRAGEAKAVEALTGRASLQDVVEAVTEAELSLQKMTAVRDRVISAYQEIIRMPI
jgi:flagellar hook-basal body complex protein FliE